ncbi:hypothetical protein IQ62_26475 [Streptomyces scabiei]|nr:hypothetical protein IQ62_26475 [Streptomyces scabiei]
MVRRLRLVEGDDGVDQGETVFPQAGLAGGALPGGVAGPRREFAGGGGFGEPGRGAVPVALLDAVGPADQSRGFSEQVAQRATYVVGVLLVGQQRLELSGCGQAQLREGEQDLCRFSLPVTC